MRPTASAIVVNWNGERLLDRCLTSLAGQTYGEREVILVDNGSTDDSVGFVRRRFPDVRIVALPENRGFAGGNCEGLKAAKGEFIALVNNDVRVEAQWLERLCAAMAEHPEAGICASKVLVEGTSRINSAGSGVTTAGVGFNRGAGAPASAYERPAWVFGGYGAAVLYRRTMLDDVGFLDEDFFLYEEETDLNFRAQLAGWKCLYVPDAVAHHLVGATANGLPGVRAYYHARNLELTWVKNMPGLLMMRYAHDKAVQETLSLWYHCVMRGQWRPFIRGKRDALKMLPRMLGKRRSVQRKRRVSSADVGALLAPVLGREWLRQKRLQLSGAKH
jgi:GT2 family glycosyltransferase